MRDAKELETIDGLEYIASAPDGEIITGMIENGGILYITTDKHIYKLINDKRLERLLNPQED